MFHVSINDLVFGDVLARSLRFGLKLRVFDHLNASESLDSLSQKTRTDIEVLGPLLHMYAEYGIVHREGETYRNSRAATDCLHHEGEYFVGKQLGFFYDSVYPIFENRLSEFEKGKLRPFQKLSALKKLKTKFYSRKQKPREFAHYISQPATIAGREISEHFDFSKIKKIIDLGGNDGSFLAPILERNPHLRGVTLDLPVVKSAAVEKMATTTVRERWEFCGIDFLHKEIPESDCYSCGYVFHDWNDRVSDEILGKMARALPTGGTLILHENLLDDPEEMKRKVYSRSNFMLVMMSYGGSYASGEKTTGQYDVWFNKHGLELKRVIHGSGKSFLIANKI